MVPWIDGCPGCPKSLLGPKQPNLAPANPSAEPTATPADENTKPFLISPGWPCKRVTHYTFSASVPGVHGPLWSPLSPPG